MEGYKNSKQFIKIVIFDRLHFLYIYLFNGKRIREKPNQIRRVNVSNNLKFWSTLVGMQIDEEY